MFFPCKNDEASPKSRIHKVFILNKTKLGVMFGERTGEGRPKCGTMVQHPQTDDPAFLSNTF
jgi:hypothetical protein